MKLWKNSAASLMKYQQVYITSLIRVTEVKKRGFMHPLLLPPFDF